MAYNQGNAARNNNTQRRTTQQGDDSWKAQGFLNVYVPTKGGGRKKLVGIPLREKNALEARILELAGSDDDKGTNLKKIIQALEFEFNPVQSQDEITNDLPF